MTEGALSPAPGDAAGAEPPLPEPAIWASRESASAELLKAVLVWSTRRIGAVLGGCVLLSARTEPIEEAIGGSPGAAPLAPIAGQIQQLVVSAPALGAIAGLAEETAASVTPLAAGGKACRLDPALEEELQGHRLARPQLALANVDGHLAGALWLCRAGADPGGERRAEAALRSVQPLIEACVGGLFADPSAEGSPLPPAALVELTPREDTVARLAIAGKRNAEIAAALGISESTVKKHMNRILAKHGVRTRSQLIARLVSGVGRA